MPANRESAPQALVEVINMKWTTAEYGVWRVSLNGPKLLIPDWFDIEVEVVRQFGDVKMPWTAEVVLCNDIGVNKANAYGATTIVWKVAIN